MTPKARKPCARGGAQRGLTSEIEEESAMAHTERLLATCTRRIPAMVHTEEKSMLARTEQILMPVAQAHGDGGKINCRVSTDENC